MRAAFQCFNGLAPRGKVPKSINISFDFSTISPQAVDFLQEEEFQAIEFIQTVFIDNSVNPQALVIDCEISQQEIVCPAYSQGIFPVIAPEKTRMIFSTVPRAGLIVPVQFLNVPMAYAVWSAGGYGPQAVNLAPAAIGDNVLVAASPGVAVHVSWLSLVVGGATNLTFFDGPSVNALPLFGPLFLTVNGSSATLPGGTLPYFQTSVGNGLVMKSSAGVNVGGGFGFMQA